MKQLNIRIKMAFVPNGKITIDGEKVVFKRDSYGNYTYTQMSDKNDCTIKIVNYLDINRKMWFLTNILCFLLSIFGLFDQRVSKNCVVRDCEFKVKLDKEITNIDINTYIGTNKSGYATINCDGEYETISNNIYVDEVAKKRLKTLKIAKIITALLIIGIIIGVLYAVEH